MRIAVVVGWLEPGRAGGGEMATAALLQGLDQEGQVTVVTSALSLPWVQGLGLTRTEVRVAASSPPRATLPRGLALARASLFGGGLARLLDAEFDVVHFPLLPSLPLRRATSVVTMWDVNHRDRPWDYSRSTRVYRRVAYDRAARRAHRILSPTTFTAERLRAQLGVEAQVLLPGVLRRPLEGRLPPGLPDRFLYYPAAWWPHKNHERLFEALDATELPLVLSGGPAGAVEAAAATAGRMGVGKRVTHLGYVPDATVWALYRAAEALVYPSLYEGFGIPPLEAMSCGTPVLAGDIPPVREVMGGAGMLVDPQDTDALRTALAQLAGDAGLRARLAAAGRERASFFSAAAGARRHLEGYRAAARSSNGTSHLAR